MPNPDVVRHARAADLREIAAIEESGLALFEEALGDLTGDPLATAALSGGQRLDKGGFLLVVGPLGTPYAFAHVVADDGVAHLAQLSVRPERMRAGVGSALVRASMEEARWWGYTRLSLTTYRDLPWNGPFYAGLGFVEDPTPEAFEQRQLDRQRAAGLERHGIRVVMYVAL